MKKIVPKDNGVKFAIGCKKKNPHWRNRTKCVFRSKKIRLPFPCRPYPIQQNTSRAVRKIAAFQLHSSRRVIGAAAADGFILYIPYIRIIHVYVIITYISCDVFVCVQYNI